MSSISTRPPCKPGYLDSGAGRRVSWKIAAVDFTHRIQNHPYPLDKPLSSLSDRAMTSGFENNFEISITRSVWRVMSPSITWPVFGSRAV